MQALAAVAAAPANRVPMHNKPGLVGVLLRAADQGATGDIKAFALSALVSLSAAPPNRAPMIAVPNLVGVLARAQALGFLSLAHRCAVALFTAPGAEELRIESVRLPGTPHERREAGGELLVAGLVALAEILAADPPKPLPRPLAALTESERLNFRHVEGLNTTTAALIVPAFRALTKLQSVDVSCSGAKVIGAVTLAPALVACPAGLEELTTKGTKLGEAGGRALASVVQAHRATLRVLDICSSKLGDEGIAALAEVLGACIALEKLNVERNAIRSAGVVTLAEALGSCTRLQELNLEGNRAGVEGARALAQRLRALPSLTTLNLVGNEIRDAGTFALAPVFEIATLEVVDLSGNLVTATGLRGLAPAVIACGSLKQLGLEWNLLGDGGAGVAAEIVRRSPRLERLALHDHTITMSGWRTLGEAARFASPAFLNEDAWVVQGPRNMAYWQALALFGGAPHDVIGGGPGCAAARRFVGRCGDHAVLLLIVGMLVA